MLGTHGRTRAGVLAAALRLDRAEERQAAHQRAQEAAPATNNPISTIIDLPGDPVLVRRETIVAPKPLGVALPISLASNTKVESVAFFVSGPLTPPEGGDGPLYQQT